MNIIYLKLYAANQKCKQSFCNIEKEKYKGLSIFKHASEYANQSTGFKRNGRKIEIVQVTDSYIMIKMYSEGKLEMASKAMACFTRELLRVDKEMYPDEEYHIFKECMFRDTLFKYQQISETEFWLSFHQEDEEISNRKLDWSVYGEGGNLQIDVHQYKDISDVDALKMCVDLFCGNASRLKLGYEEEQKAKEEIKSILRTVLYTSSEYERKQVENYRRLLEEAASIQFIK